MQVANAEARAVGAGLLQRAGGPLAAGYRRGRQGIGDVIREPRATFARHVAALPFDYPPMFVVLTHALLVLAGIGATIQRADYFPTALPIVAIILLSLPTPMLTIFGPPPLVTERMCAIGLIAQGLFLLQPVPTDASPFVLIVVAGTVAAIAPVRRSLPFTLVAMAELIVFDTLGPGLDLLACYLSFLPISAGVGALLQYQRRFLYQERAQQAIRAAQAAEEERRQIARDVHDVIAHALSSALLHLAAARYALQTDRDVEDAVDALTDAERLGRQAMADIRRTVRMLDAQPSKPPVEPDSADFETHGVAHPVSAAQLSWNGAPSKRA